MCCRGVQRVANAAYLKVFFALACRVCTVLRSRWYQSGINTVLVGTADQEFSRVSSTTSVACLKGLRNRLSRDAVMRSYSLTAVPEALTISMLPP